MSFRKRVHYDGRFVLPSQSTPSDVFVFVFISLFVFIVDPLNPFILPFQTFLPIPIRFRFRFGMLSGEI